MFRFHARRLTLPVDAERRIRYAVVEPIPLEPVVIQRVAELHVVRLAAADQHVRLGYAERERIDLLTETGHVGIGVKLSQTFFHAGQHLACAHGHVVHGLHNAVAAEGVTVAGNQQIAHEINDVPARKMRSGFLVVTFGKALHQILKDIAHVHGADLVGAHVRLVGTEIHDHLIQTPGLHHAVDLSGELHVRQNILHVVGKAVQIGPEVVRNVLRIGLQGFKRKRTRIVEMIPGGRTQKAVLHFKILFALKLLKHGVVRGQKAVVKTLDDDHGQNHQPVFMRLERAVKRIGHVPDEGRLVLNVSADGCQSFTAGHGKILACCFSGKAIVPRPTRYTFPRRLNSPQASLMP